MRLNMATAQGSCLAPYHSLSSLMISIKIGNTAKVYYLQMSHNSKTYIELCIQEDLRNVQDWFKPSKLTLNIDKSIIMSFGCKRNHNYEIKIDIHTLPMVTTTKFLGSSRPDLNLTWQKYLANWYLKY